MKLPASSSRQRLARVRAGAAAFTLLEVMVAVFIFFVAIFAILSLTSQTLQLARSLQRTLIDPSTLASELSLTNQLVEGSDSGTWPDHPEIHWRSDTTLVSSNGLYKVDFHVYQDVDRRVVESELSILLYRPASVQGAQNTSLGGGNRSPLGR